MMRMSYNPSGFDEGKTMKKAVLQTATFLGAISCFGLVNATETRTPLVPLPSVVDFTDGDGWGVGLGLGVEYETTYEGSEDRKSTRLNSSHVRISYAVFCLKKKKS